MPGQHSRALSDFFGLRVTLGGTDIDLQSALKKKRVNSGEENSPAAPAGIRTRNQAITSLPTSYPGSHYNVLKPKQFKRKLRRGANDPGSVQLQSQRLPTVPDRPGFVDLVLQSVVRSNTGLVP